MLSVAFFPNQSNDSRARLGAGLRSSNLNVGQTWRLKIGESARAFDASVRISCILHVRENAVAIRTLDDTRLATFGSMLVAESYSRSTPEQSYESTPITCADGLYLIYMSYTRSSTDRQFFTGKSAGSAQEFEDLWDMYVGLLQPPPVDFNKYVVVSFVNRRWQRRKMALRSTAVLNDGTIVVNFYAEGILLTGPLEDRESTNQLNTVWFMAIPRSRLPGRGVPRKIVALEPWIEVNDYPRDFDPWETRP